MAVVVNQAHRFDKAPEGTVSVYLASYCSDPLANDFDPVIAVLRSADGLDEVARWFGRHVEDGGFSWDAAYLRGPDEPYSQIPAIDTIFMIVPRNVPEAFQHAPVSQYVFTDRESAEAHANWMLSRSDWPEIEVRELALDVPLVESLGG
jgi:hypothetical protein